MECDMTLICTKCGFTQTMFLKNGCIFPQIYQWAVETIRLGKRGKEWKELLENTPNAAVNVGKHIYICDECGYFLVRQDLSIHVPLDPNTSKIHTEPYSEDYPALGMEYVLPMEIRYWYRLVKEYTHYCPECKSPLHKYRGTDILKCPECGEYAMTWDGVPLWSVKKRPPSESA